jgi:hypothetical protein
MLRPFPSSSIATRYRRIDCGKAYEYTFAGHAHTTIYSNGWRAKVA